MDWQASEVATKFPEIMARALAEGPQLVQAEDKSVVVLDQKEYDQLKKRKKTFVEFLASGPGLDGVDLTRDRCPGREVEL